MSFKHTHTWSQRLTNESVNLKYLRLIVECFPFPTCISLIFDGRRIWSQHSFYVFSHFPLRRSLHYCHVSQVPPRTLRLFLLPETAQQRHLQRAERQTLLPCLLRQTVWLKWPCANPTFVYWVGSFQLYSPLLVDGTPSTTQRASLELCGNGFSPLNLKSKKLRKHLSRLVRKFRSEGITVRCHICLGVSFLLLSCRNLNELYFLYDIFYLFSSTLHCPYHSFYSCANCSSSNCKLFQCNQLHKRNSSPRHCSYPCFILPCLNHLSMRCSSPFNFYYRVLPALILPAVFVNSYDKLVFKCNSDAETYLYRHYTRAVLPCAQLPSLLGIEFLYLIWILLSFKMVTLLHAISLILGVLKIPSHISLPVTSSCDQIIFQIDSLESKSSFFFILL